MKISIKTLKGTSFQIDVEPADTVANVKKAIETVQGSHVYPATQQMLIYQGNVLNDETTLEEQNVTENSFLVIMLTKNKATGGSSTTLGSPATTIQPATTASQASPPVTANPSPSTNEAADRKMQSLNPVYCLLFLVFTFFHFPQVFSKTDSSILSEPSSPFSIALKNLQSTLNYSFQNVALLRRAMTHASFSEENNRALSILGSSVIDSSVGLSLVNKNLDISSKDLNRQISDVSKLDGQCMEEGLHLGLDKIIRVSSKTNSSSPVVVCGAYRAIFGAVAVDSGSLDKVGLVYLKNRGVGNGMAAMM